MTTDVNRNSSSPNKVAIWSVPRSLSTVLTRSISTPSNCEVYFEYYGTACCFGPERICSPPAFRGQPPKQPEFTFDWVKKTVEKDHHGRDLILLKDPAYTVKKDGEYSRGGSSRWKGGGPKLLTNDGGSRGLAPWRGSRGQSPLAGVARGQSPLA